MAKTPSDHEPFKVTDPHLDAPDGAIIFDDAKGWFFVRSGGWWVPISAEEAIALMTADK